MKICFWNTQRNPALNQPHIAWPIADLRIACEVLGEDTLKVPKQNRRKHIAQLGYRVVTPTINVYLEEIAIDNFNTLTGDTFWHRGGNLFKLQSKRQVAQVYAVNPARLDENIFVYHCNSSARAASLMPWVIAHLVTNFDSFILLGDFNCEPDLLRKNLSYLFQEPARTAS
ncbi:MAG: hypothetical protein IPG17_27170 [Sandaracinaceae bacterium]|nr:hypothetical protein [Sandaracinaceae bacterium]